MINTIIFIFVAIIDLFLLKLYLDISLKEPKNNTKVFYYSCFLITELILCVNTLLFNYTHSSLRTIVNVLLSLLTSYFLCNLYVSTIPHKLITVFSLQLLFTIAEVSSNLLLLNVANNFYDNSPDSVDIIITFTSKLVMLLLITISKFFWNKKTPYFQAKNIFYELFIPILSIILFLVLPTEVWTDDKHTLFLTIYCICLCIMSLYSFYIFDYFLQNTLLERENLYAKKQLEFHANKYKQLSASYRDTRKLIHDTKNHYICLEKYIDEGQIDKAIPYLNKSMNLLENNYILLNCGNLVVDSLINNLAHLCNEENITLETNININSDVIPIDDYDLCVILGNMIDNAYTAVSELEDISKKSISITIHTQNHNFVIGINNYYSKRNNVKSINHGYGCKNISDIVTRHSGIYVVKEKEKYTSTVAIPLNTEI